jgi:hypothetical protein
MEIDSIRNVLKYKTGKTTLCLKDVSRADQLMIYRLLRVYPDRLRVCCPTWSVWITGDSAVSSCVETHR